MTAAEPLAAAPPGTAGTAETASAPPRAVMLYGVYAAALAALFWPTLSEMAATWFSSSAYHHGVLVAPIALMMIAASGAPDSAPEGAPRASPVSFIGLGAAALVWLVGHAGGVNLIEQAGFVSLLIAGAAAIFGATAVRRWAFPLAFLYFMVPFGGALMPALQGLAAQGVIFMLHASGVTATLDGTLITTSAGPFLIAEACAGLNFLLAATMIAAVYAHIAFRGWPKIAAFVFFAVVFALIANILRAYLVIVFETLTAGRYAVADNHVLVGWAFYGVLVFILIALGERFADPRPASCPGKPVGAVRRRAGALILGCAILAATSAYGRLVVDRAPAMVLPTALPLINAPGWRVIAPSTDWRAAVESADRTLFARYQTGAAQIELAAAYFAYDRRGAEIVGSATRAYDGRDWRRVGGRALSVAAWGATVRLRIETLQNAAGARLDAASLYWLGEDVFADPRALKIRQARDRLIGRNRRGGVFIIAAPAAQGADGAPAIQAFLESAEPLERWLARIDATLSN